MRRSKPDMLVVVDSSEDSQGAVQIARRHAAGTLVLHSWGAPVPDIEAELRESRLAEPTINEVLATAANERIPWVALRRNFMGPETLLRELLMAAARHNDDDIPGFAVFLASKEHREFRRILAIVDRSSGPMSGLLAHAAVSVADSAGAELDILVMGAAGENVSSDDELASLAIRSELELYEGAVSRARERNIRVNWLAAGEVASAWHVVADQLSQHDYDLVVDDLGDLTVHLKVMGAPVERSLAPGAPGDVPLRLLKRDDLTVLLVIDEIRLGIAPSTVLKAGTLAALTLGVVSGGIVTVLRPSVAAEHVDETRTARDLTRRLEDELADDPTAQAPPADETAPAPETAAQPVAYEAPPPPPEDAPSPEEVAEAQEQAQESKDELKEAEQRAEEAAAAMEAAEENFQAAQEQAEEALAELEAAQEAMRQATVVAPVTITGPEDTPTVVAPEPTAEAQAAADEASEQLDAAIEAGSEALAHLETAHAAVAEGQAEVTEATASLGEAEARYSSDRKTADAYSDLLAESRACPVDGDYNLTAHFGDSGGNWSSGMHTGLDFAAPTGTDVVAAADGVVVSAGWEGAYGNQIVIEHEDGYTTTYSHLSDIDVRVGEEVSAGDHIGDVGSTGNSTGPHLHFEVLKDDKYIDPEYWLGW